MPDIDPLAPAPAGAARITRQAVVIIHGIGEQSPMSTLRSFIEAVLPPGKEGRALYYSRPDQLSNLFELRRLISQRGRPKTEFYEFYWAHRMPVASWQRVRSWFVVLLLRPVDQVPAQLRPLWWASWATITLVVALVATGIGKAFWTAAGVINWAIWPLIALLFGAIGAKLLAYVGDAAIYLSANPQTVTARQEIRAAGIELLERLHDSGEFDRIVVVGHSLGSVIGYDLINHLWQRYHEKHGDVDRPEHPALREMEALLRTGGTLPPARWQELVGRLWREQRGLGNPWLISDFITLGSPLAHAALLLARDPADLNRRVLQRELPVAPPVSEAKGRISYEVGYQLASGDLRRISVLHSAAPFAVTRWTNLYFPSHAIVRGDVVGGPLAPLFGVAINDIPVTTRRRLGLFSHVYYWSGFDADTGRADAPVAVLQRALALWPDARGAPR